MPLRITHQIGRGTSTMDGLAIAWAVLEALHGAIAADTLRVPWVPMRPLAPTHRAKWADWGDSLGLRIDFAPLVPSSVQEAREEAFGLARARDERQLGPGDREDGDDAAIRGGGRRVGIDVHGGDRGHRQPERGAIGEDLDQRRHRQPPVERRPLPDVAEHDARRRQDQLRHLEQADQPFP